MESLPEELWNKIHLSNSHPCADIMRPLIESTHYLITNCPVEKKVNLITEAVSLLN